MNLPTTTQARGYRLNELAKVLDHPDLDEVSLLCTLLDTPDSIYVTLNRITPLKGKATSFKSIVNRNNLSKLRDNGWRYEPVIAHSPALSNLRAFILDCQNPVAIMQSLPFTELTSPFDDTLGRMDAICHVWADADFIDKLYGIPKNDLTVHERSLLTGVGRRYFYAKIGADDEEETKDRMKAVEALGKLDGDFVERKEVHTTSEERTLTLVIGESGFVPKQLQEIPEAELIAED
ncbi:MAG: hypothetical protein DRP45_00900 [Candidatus Zixiibacteriota bacterium]|nr:MAG: hypothetical protein DRP45_00900 [candidate division Zixibacteria bacterium]